MYSIYNIQDDLFEITYIIRDDVFEIISIIRDDVFEIISIIWDDVFEIISIIRDDVFEIIFDDAYYVLWLIQFFLINWLHPCIVIWIYFFWIS